MENTPKRKRNNDEFNKLSKFAVTLSILALLTLAFAKTWLWINDNLVQIWAFDVRGN